MKSTVTAQLDEGQQLLIVNKYSNAPNFTRVGTRNEGKTLLLDGIDYWQELLRMSKHEIFVMSTIVQSIKVWKIGSELKGNTIGEVQIYVSTFTVADQNRWNRGVAGLKQKNLLLSTKRSFYMLHPNLIIPMDYSNAVKTWVHNVL